MQVRGKRFSNWWLLLLIPILGLSAPFVLILFFAANNLAGTIFGPPAIWNRTWHSTPREDLIGRYTESQSRRLQALSNSQAKLELSDNGTMIVTELPFGIGEKTCILSGTGTWTGRMNTKGLILSSLR